MTRLVMGCLLLAAWVTAGAAQEPPPATAPAIVDRIAITGAHELGRDELLAAAHVRPGEPLEQAPAEIAAAVERHYHDQGYTYATAAAALAGGTLTLTIDEGVIGGVEFRGVDEGLARELASDFALKAGDVFNRSRALDALKVLLRPTRGAIAPRRKPFDLVDADGGRRLLVRLREPAGRVRLVPDLGDREDWFTPVDGFVPSLGFGAAIFDHTSFNHAFVSGHLSFKTASDNVGYALGVEKPFFGARKLYVGGEVHDLTATDDLWRVTSFEASVAAMAARDSFRDYYRRRGVQLNAAFRADPRLELLLAWRTEREEPLPVATDFSVWNGDDTFRPNRLAADGRLQALVFGASMDSRGFERESLETTYLRHQMDRAFGSRLGDLDERPAEWRVDWQSEVSSPGATGGDFDFSRSIVSARFRANLSPHQAFGARAIGGWSTGALPPQRLFAVGGIGSVIGYPFETEIGSSMALANLEYSLGWRHGPRVFGLFDAGRATTAAGGAAWLKGVGVGLGLGDEFRVDFGYRLDAVPGSLQVLVRFGRTF